MHIPRTVEDIEDLARLSDRAEQRIVASLPLFLAIESHRGALSKAAGADDRTVKVKGQATKAE